MSAYDPTVWRELFVMVGGAAAALAGLLFVAVSLNYEHILEIPTLPSLAARSLSVLLALVLLCVFGLTPGQTVAALGTELLVLGLILATGVITTTIRNLKHSTQRNWKLSLLSVAAICTLPIVIAGASMILGYGGGLYWALVAIVAGLVASTYYAWILLIEIRR